MSTGSQVLADLQAVGEWLNRQKHYRADDKLEIDK